MTFTKKCCLFIAAGLAYGTGVAGAQTSGGAWQEYGTDNGEWRSYAGDIGGTKYSPLEQIDATNFSELEIAWEWT